MVSPAPAPPVFKPLPADFAGSVSWIHLGDLHMTNAEEPNAVDLGRIVDAINTLYSRSGVSFVYVPGDIADHGSDAEYRVVRSHLDRLQLPWCGIVGDHDVHEKSFENFRTFIAKDLTSSFTVGRYRFLRLNAFALPRPDAFTVDEAQLRWIEEELRDAQKQDQRCVLLLHCYPSDLKQGGSALTELVRKYSVLLVDMGHTHYNELSNDGRVLYSATRSTGQIEEGEVGFSVVTADGSTVSWDFVPVASPELLAITAPADHRLTVAGQEAIQSPINIHAKVWSNEPVQRVTASLNGALSDLHQQDGVSWQGTLSLDTNESGPQRLHVQATRASGAPLEGAIELAAGEMTSHHYAPVDQDNAIGAWEEHGILGTQLGPNKNGRKW